MYEELERALKVLLGKINQAVQPDAALRYTQSASYLAHVLEAIEGIRDKRSKTKGAGS